jgi:hypothetical protein
MDDSSELPQYDLADSPTGRAFRWIGLIAALGFLAIAAYNMQP